MSLERKRKGKEGPHCAGTRHFDILVSGQLVVEG